LNKVQSFLEDAGEAISPAERQWLKDRHAAAGADTSQASNANGGKADSQEVAAPKVKVPPRLKSQRKGCELEKMQEKPEIETVQPPKLHATAEFTTCERVREVISPWVRWPSLSHIICRSSMEMVGMQTVWSSNSAPGANESTEAQVCGRCVCKENSGGCWL